MRHLVSGGAGFIGSHLCDVLLANGDQVVALDNLITGSTQNLVHLSNVARFHFLKCDVTSTIDVDGRFDYVWHLASLASPKHYQAHPIETLEVGAAGTRNMLEIALREGARFLLASTSECYGDPDPRQLPLKETYWGHVNPVGPRSCYDESKRYAEALTMVYHERLGADTAIARIFNTYGPRMALNDGRVVPAFIYQALRGQPLSVFGDGSQTRSFCYIADLVEGLVRLARSKEHEPTNLGNPLEMTILEFAEHVCRLAGSELRIDNESLPGDDPQRRCPDISKARHLLHWEPAWSLEAGLRQTIEYFKPLVSSAIASG